MKLADRPTSMPPLTDSKSRVFFKENNSCSSNQEITRLLWKTEFCYCVHENPTLIPVLIQMNPTLSLLTSILTSSRLHLIIICELTVQ